MGLIVVTDRLKLVQLDVADAQAMIEGERPLGHAWAEDYPTERSLVAAGIVVAAESEQDPVGAFGTFLIQSRHDGLVVGDCGFHGPPDPLGSVTIGFEIAPSARGRGYGTEAVEALLAYARTLPGVLTVHAETTRANVAAQRVLEKAGLSAVTDGDLVLYVG